MHSKIYDHYKSNGNNQTDINISPLIDMVFILLIFFIVTTSFVKETGITVEKPSAATAEQLKNQSIMIGITASGEVFHNGKKTNLLSLRAIVKRELVGQADKPVIIIADEDSRNSTLVDVIDECKLAGAKKISLASEKE